ncbi:MAG TPA: hydroxyacid dehydrogenase, partial [Candidatus Aenigmarchaeota archaeon]|nr:hydroxyacid dehydrogenase [Candidatus Aenigmarchaeota archaeon]
MVKIAFFEISEQDKAFFRKNVNGSMVFYKERLSLKNIEKARGCEVVCISIYSKINKAVIDKLPSLKFIATRSTGYDHIDTRECRKRGIAVSNVPDYSNNAVAEHTFALILALFRNMKSVLKGVQERSKLSGAELKGKTIGVIGTGKIGMNVIRIAKGFGMKVIAYDINKNIKASHTIGFKYTSLDYLFRHADIITLHVPYTEKTHHLIN